MRVGEANNLARVAGIGEDFLVASERSVENDFAATTGARARRAAVKDPPVFEREPSGAWGWVGQRDLLGGSFCGLGHIRNGAETIHRPVGKHGLAVNKTAGHRSKDARVVGAGAMVAHHEEGVVRYTLRAV